MTVIENINIAYECNDNYPERELFLIMRTTITFYSALWRETPP